MTPAEYQRHLARAMTEAQLQAQVIRLAETLHWRWYHVHRSDRSPAGYPDLTLVRDGRLIFAELKRQLGRVSPAQKHWLADLGAVPGVLAVVWRPSDLLDGTITRILT